MELGQGRADAHFGRDLTKDAAMNVAVRAE
jgi:hypothetical protein